MANLKRKANRPLLKLRLPAVEISTVDKLLQSFEQFGPQTIRLPGRVNLLEFLVQSLCECINSFHWPQFVRQLVTSSNIFTWSREMSPLAIREKQIRFATAADFERQIHQVGWDAAERTRQLAKFKLEQMMHALLWLAGSVGGVELRVAFLRGRALSASPDCVPRSG